MEQGGTLFTFTVKMILIPYQLIGLPEALMNSNFVLSDSTMLTSPTHSANA